MNFMYDFKKDFFFSVEKIRVLEKPTYFIFSYVSN